MKTEFFIEIYLDGNPKNLISQQMQLELVVAVSKDNVIGYRDIAKNQFKMPWRIPLDQKQFHDLTVTPEGKSWNVVIMGRHTWESLPKSPLSNRINIVITRAENIFSNKIEHCKSVIDFDPEEHKAAMSLKAFTAPTLPSAIEFLKRKLFPIDKVFVIGGYLLYAEAMSRSDCSILHVTRIDKTVKDILNNDGKDAKEMKESKEQNNQTWISFPPIPAAYKLTDSRSTQVIEKLSNDVVTMTNEVWKRERVETELKT
jgi:dihydrofolate reductase